MSRACKERVFLLLEQRIGGGCYLLAVIVSFSVVALVLWAKAPGSCNLNVVAVAVCLPVPGRWSCSVVAVLVLGDGPWSLEPQCGGYGWLGCGPWLLDLQYGGCDRRAWSLTVLTSVVVAVSVTVSVAGG